MKDEHIKAILGHEFGHLAHKDTDFILLVSVGNLIITTIVIIFKIISFLACTLVDACLEESGFGTFFHFLFTVSVSIFMWIWTKIGVLLVMKSSRENEYEADDFSLRLGFGKELCEGLDAISVSDNKIKGLFANLVSSHPDTKDRIARLQSNGAEYNKKLA